VSFGGSLHEVIKLLIKQAATHSENVFINNLVFNLFGAKVPDVFAFGKVNLQIILFYLYLFYSVTFVFYAICIYFVEA
jgi:hypothetical protein